MKTLAFGVAGLALLATLVPAPGWAQEAPPEAAKIVADATLPTLTVKVLEDGGGLPTNEADRTLRQKLTMGLTKYLTESLGAQYAVNGKIAKGGAGLSLTGRLSRIANGAYLCVVQLRDDRAGTLIGQWAGVAPNLRCLSDNFSNVPGIDKEGLLGELGKRLTAALSPASVGVPAALESVVRRGGAQALVQLDTASDSDTMGLARLLPGQKYRLKVTPSVVGQVFVLTEEPDGTLVPGFVPGAGEEIVLDKGESATLPSDKPWIAGPKQGKQTFYVLVRSTTPLPATGAAPPIPEADGGSGKRDRNPTSVGDAEGDYIKVIGGSGNLGKQTRKIDPLVAKFLTRIEGDPAGTWSGTKVTVTVGSVAPVKRAATLAAVVEHVQPDAATVTLSASPKGALRVNQNVLLSTTTRPGYLVVLEKGTSGQYTLLFPASANVDQAKVGAERVEIDSFRPVLAGEETILSYHFPDRESARLFLSAYRRVAQNLAAPGQVPAYRASVQMLQKTSLDDGGVALGSIFTHTLKIAVRANAAGGER